MSECLHFVIIAHLFSVTTYPALRAVERGGVGAGAYCRHNRSRQLITGLMWSSLTVHRGIIQSCSLIWLVYFVCSALWEIVYVHFT